MRCSAVGAACLCVGAYLGWAVRQAVGWSRFLGLQTAKEPAWRLLVIKGAAVIVLWKPSPHWNERPVGRGPDLIVIHGTAGKTDAGDLTWLRDPRSKVSYHYLVGRDGAVYQLVHESKRAWHAGVSKWRGRRDCNDFSIGVALSNDSTEAYTPEQYTSGARVVADIIRRRGIRLENVVGHADIAPNRKADPWSHFDWKRFRVEVINHLHPPPPTVSVEIPSEDDLAA